jgi:hemolysin activation/secretion protein
MGFCCQMKCRSFGALASCVLRVWISAAYKVRLTLVGSCFSFLIVSNGAMAQESSKASEQPAAPTFQLNELRVLGNTVLPPLRIESVLIRFLGESKTLQDVEAARLALESEYHALGYGTVYVDIPEQSVGNDGVVRLKVTEAYLRSARITGTRYFSNRQIRSAIPESKAENIPNLPQLQSQINQVNAVTSDRQVVPVLKAGSVPGTVDLELKVKDVFPLHASLELNNQYTADTSPLRAMASLSYDNAFARQDSLSMQYQSSPQETSEVKVFAASYLARLGDTNKNKLSASYIDSSSEVVTIGDVTVAGAGKNYSLDWIRGLDLGSKVVSSFTVGLRYKESDQGVSLSANQSLQTPLSYANAQLGYNASLFAERYMLSFSTSWGFGFSSLGSSRQEFADKCYGCKPNFSVLRMEGGYKQKLFWKISSSVRVTGQYSVDPLVSNEQFLIGGGRNVRGYLEAEELGDIGMRGSFELRVSELPAFWGISLQPYTFYDAGRVSFQLPLPGQDRSSSLQSVGLGLDILAWQHITGTVSIAEALTTSSHTQRGEDRIQFSVRGAW